MLTIWNENTDPYFNIASEEYLLKHFEEEIFMVYINKPSIIVGKHQNTLAEVNYQWVIENQLPVIRRISGGGTVFHDFGNINFLFIYNGKEGNLVNFKSITQPVIDFLAKCGLDAKFEGKNDIRVNGLKISGNAEHVHRTRVLHHGTLLYSSNLHSLENALRVKPGQYKDNAVQSNRSAVENISNFLNQAPEIVEFRMKLYQFIKNLKNGIEYHFTDHDIVSIQKMATDKYKTWEWNFGYSLPYTLAREIRFNNKLVTIELKIENGIVQSVATNYEDDDIQHIINSIRYQKHDFKTFLNIFFQKIPSISDCESLAIQFF